MAASDTQVEQVPLTVGAVTRFFLKLYDQKKPCADDLDQLRKIMAANPESLDLLGNETDRIRRGIIAKHYSNEAHRVLVMAEMDVLRQQLGCDHASVLERMHIDHVLTSWLRLREAEMQFTHCLNVEGVNTAVVQFRQGYLESAQVRFLRASEALEKIRRLARNTPALQINIAQAGGKQVNIQSDAPAGGNNLSSEALK